MIERVGFNSILEDNEEHYYQLLDSAITSVDEYSSTVVTKTPSSIKVRVVPSKPKNTELLLKQILELHNLLQLKLSLSKSMKSSANINFSLEF